MHPSPSPGQQNFGFAETAAVPTCSSAPHNINMEVNELYTLATTTGEVLLGQSQWGSSNGEVLGAVSKWEKEQLMSSRNYAPSNFQKKLSLNPYFYSFVHIKNKLNVVKKRVDHLWQSSLACNNAQSMSASNEWMVQQKRSVAIFFTVK